MSFIYRFIKNYISYTQYCYQALNVFILHVFGHHCLVAAIFIHVSLIQAHGGLRCACLTEACPSHPRRSIYKYIYSKYHSNAAIKRSDNYDCNAHLRDIFFAVACNQSHTYYIVWCRANSALLTLVTMKCLFGMHFLWSFCVRITICHLVCKIISL